MTRRDYGGSILTHLTWGRHRINAHRTHTNIHASSGIRTHNISVGVGKDSSCLRSRGHCDRLYFINKVGELVGKSRSKDKVISLKTVVAKNPNSMYFWPISEEEIVTEALKLKGKTTAGSDGIPDLLIKACITFIRKPLNFIFNESINERVFPDLLKVTKIRPVYKRGSKQEASNYRPISVL
jgi:hypothetical protein